ncbi:MAG: GH3 family domain-containing protein [Solirubrobacterales bacterium]
MSEGDGTSGSEPRGEEYRRRVLEEKRRLESTLSEPAEWQRRVLDEVLSENAGTEFGAAHGLASVSGPDELRRAVPIRTHEELMPWIERVIAGEPNLLTADEPVVYFSSSGTTGREKHIPVTRSYMRRCFLPFYYATFARVVEHHPGLLAGDERVLNLWQDPHSPIERTAGGQPHIGPSQVDYRKFGERLAVGLGNRAPWSRLPDELGDAGPWERAYLRLRLAAEHDVRCVIGVNPAIVAALPYQLEQWWPRIVKEIRDGTLGGHPHNQPNPERARRIEELAEYFGTVRPAELWPRIELIITWNTALASLYLPRVTAAFGPGVRVLPAPVASCEGPVGVALDRHPTAAPLVVSACFYEFIPAEEEIAPDSETLLAGELEAGRDYHVVLTHVGGLYRCAVSDIVRVVDFVERTPRVEYAGRSVIRSGAGERLLEPHVVRALRDALADCGLEIRNATCRLADGDGGVPRYEVAVAALGGPSESEIAALARALDARLGEQSRDYRAERKAERLAPLDVHPTHPDAFLREWERRVRAGERPPRVKDRVFQPDPDAWERLVADRDEGTVASRQSPVAGAAAGAPAPSQVASRRDGGQ